LFRRQIERGMAAADFGIDADTPGHERRFVAPLAIDQQVAE
jgi:hypothetical protein